MLQSKRNLLKTLKIVFGQSHSCSRFVPKHEPVHEKDIENLARFLDDKPNILVLTGAGVSTESGDTTECQWMQKPKHVECSTEIIRSPFQEFPTIAQKVLGCMHAVDRVRCNT